MLLSNYIGFTQHSLADNKVHSKYIRCIHATKALVVMMHNAKYYTLAHIQLTLTKTLRLHSYNQVTDSSNKGS